MKILFTGGGTAGHILPLVAVARELRIIYDKRDLKLYYIGPRDPFANEFLSQEGIKVITTSAGKYRRHGGIKVLFPNILDVFFRIPLGIIQALWKVFFLSPDLLLSKGGYGSIPATFASWFLRTPVYLHESDILPGLANRIGGKFAIQVFTSFPNTQYFSRRKVMEVGNPIRRKMLEGTKKEAIRIFELQGDKPLVLILGGSQGSTRINDMLLEILPGAVKYFEFIHQTGKENLKDVKEGADVMLPNKNNRAYYHPIAFLKETELKHAFAACAFVVSRAGSGSIFEIAAFNKPSILIPLPESAQNHQLENAYAYARTKATVVLEESNITPHFFLERLKYLVSSPKEAKEMSAGALAFSKPEASRIIASYIIEYLQK